MVPALNYVLFYFSTLFTIQPSLIAEQTKIIIDFELHTVNVTYLDIKTSLDDIEFAEENIKFINETSSFKNPIIPEFTLISKNFEKKKGKLNCNLTFSFKDKNWLLKTLYFNESFSYKEAPKDVIYYHLLKDEKLKSSNGVKKKGKHNRFLIWKQDVKQIKLKLTQKNSSQKTFNNLVSVAKYWSE